VVVVSVVVPVAAGGIPDVVLAVVVVLAVLVVVALAVILSGGVVVPGGVGVLALPPDAPCPGRRVGGRPRTSAPTGNT
jgi:hypothetical protein